MLALSRFRYDAEDAVGAEADLTRCLEGLGACSGYLDGTVGRALDDPSLWVLHTRWANVGAYRRALSSYDIKMQVVPLLARAVDEPSAYEVIAGDGATPPNSMQLRGTVT